MNHRLVSLVLGIALVVSLLILGRQAVAMRLPGNHQGYEPSQPIAYSHRLHAGELQIPCQYCHSAAERSPHAGIPAASTCMNCHQAVTAGWGAVRAEDELATKEKRRPRAVVSAELQKLYDALGLGPDRQRDPSRPTRPIVWNRIHKLPDFVRFDHSAHVGAGVTCQSCHGPVETMERVRQVNSLSMGWCVDCHRKTKQTGVAGRKVQPSTDCATCHH